MRMYAAEKKKKKMFLFLVSFFLLPIVVVPLGVDFLRVFFPHWNLSRVVGKVAHFFLFFTVLALVLIILRYQHFVYLPLIVNHENPFKSYEGVLHVIFSSWLWVNVLGNYYHTISMDPGRMDETKPASSSNVEHHMRRNSAVREFQRRILHDYPIPRTGTEWRSSRSHFCPICQHTICYWDHHCPFTGNCIGLRNYSNFFIGLCYGMVGSIYAAVITWPFFYRCNLRPLFTGKYEQERLCTELGTDSYIFLPVLIGCYLSCGMVVLHVLLLLADLSSYDVQKYWSRYPVVKFLFQRIHAKKFLDESSRLQVLLLKQRKHFTWYLFPVRNTDPSAT